MSVLLLANENFPRPALLLLREHGLDIESVAEIMPRASDRTILTHATDGNRWILTFDRDYGELVFARTVPPPPAIVYLRQGAYDPTWPAEAVLSLTKRADFVKGHLVSIQGRSVRRRAVPTQPT